MSILQKISLIEDVNIPENVMNDLFDINFENELKRIKMNLDPICVLINKCQDPVCNIPDSTQYWLSLNLPSNDYNQIIEDRIKKSIWPVGYCANLLHNTYKGQLLNEEQRKRALEFLKENLKEFYEEYESFCTDEEIVKQLSEKCDSLLLFWNLCEFQFPNLSKFATKLMLIPASTAQIEGLFSNWTYVHNCYCNRLTNENSGKLVDIYHALRYINEKEISKKIYEQFPAEYMEFD